MRHAGLTLIVLVSIGTTSGAMAQEMPATEVPTAPAEAPTPAATESGISADGADLLGWDFDGSMGIPKLDSGDLALDFDVSAGYRGDGWGSGGRFAYDGRSFANGDGFSNTTDTNFTLYGFYLTDGSPSHSSWVLRSELDYVGLSTSYIDLGTAGGSFSAENSTVTRATLLAGFRSPETQQTSWAILGGLGYQSETYGQVSDSGDNFDDPNATGADTSFEAQSTTRMTARARVRHELTSSWALRLKGDLDRYTIRRMAIFFGDLEGAATLEEVTNTRVAIRLNADWNSMQLIGLSPTAFLGVDYLMATGDSGDNSTFVPLIGVGLFGR